MMILLQFSLALAVIASPAIDQSNRRHRNEIKSGSPADVRILTEQEGVRNLLPQSSSPWLKHPTRDEGEGELLWSATDDNAIAEKVAVSGVGGIVAIGYQLNDVRYELRDSRTGDILLSYPTGEDVVGVALTVDGDLAAFSAGDSVWLWDTGDLSAPLFRYRLEGMLAGPVAVRMAGGLPQYPMLIAAAIDPDGVTNKVLELAVEENEIHWEVEIDAKESYGLTGIALDPAESMIVVNGKDHWYAIRLESGEVLDDGPTYNTESRIAVSFGGEIIAIASLSGWVRVLGFIEESNSYEELWRYRLTGGISCWANCCAISGDATTLAVGTLDFFDDHYAGRVALFDPLGDGEPIWISDPLADEISDIALSEDGSIIAATSWGDLDNETPDLVLFERHDRVPFYSLSTPGSFSSVAMSWGAIAAAGKAVHNRAWGRGGQVYAVSAELHTATVTGHINNEGGMEGDEVTITAEDSPYVTKANVGSDYSLMVLVEDQREVTLTASGVGYQDEIIEGVSVARGERTSNVDFHLSSAGDSPTGLRASRNLENAVELHWDSYNGGRSVGSGWGGLSASSVDGSLPVSPSAEGFSTRSRPLGSRDPADAINIYRVRLPVRALYERVLVGSINAQDSVFIDRNRLAPDHDYLYAITADFGDGESRYSSWVTGNLNHDYLDWNLDLAAMQNTPTVDGIFSADEWRDAEVVDISDTYGYDGPDTTGSVKAWIGFSDDLDSLFIGVQYRALDSLENKSGIGIYIDDDGNGAWTGARPGSEGNYWAYWIDGAPDLRYRSFTGQPYATDPYYSFVNPELAFGTEHGFVEVEMALPLGFHSPEQIALYAPDYTIGLGLFAVHRNADSVAVFNGWWPQDMLSIVTEPEQFARVRIPAVVAAPPQEPDVVALARDGEAMLLAWTDPIRGVDGGEVRNLTGINIYRNGERLTSTNPGVGQYRDDQVYYGGWYEYSLAGYTLDNGEPFEGPRTQPVGLYAGQEPQVTEIGYDDSSAEGYYVVSFDSGDHRFAAQFDLSGASDSSAVYWVDVFTGSPGAIDLYITRDANSSPGVMVGERFTAQIGTGGQFNRFHFPANRQPVVDLVNLDYIWAVLRYLPDSPSSPSIGVDQSITNSTGNKYYLDDQGWRGFNTGQLMIRIGVGGPLGIPPDEEEPLPTEFSLGQNFPNPFNGRSMLPLLLPQSSQVRLELTDSEGRLVSVQSLGRLAAGRRLIPIESQDLTAGVYFARVVAGSEHRTAKVSLIK